MIQIFQEQTYNQYLIIAFAILVLFAFKLYFANKAYQNKLKSFIHPDTIIQDIKKKFKSVEDAQNLLSYNILKLNQDYSRLRNIAFLVAYLKVSKIPIQPLKSKLEETFKKIDEKKIQKTEKLYKQYILKEVSNKKQQNVESIQNQKKKEK